MEMTSIGFIKDKLGEEYEVKMSKRKRNDKTRYLFDVFYKPEMKIGTFEFDVFDNEKYANVEYCEVDNVYFRQKGIYTSFLIFAKYFFKKEGLNGIFSKGKLRSSTADKVWDKIKDKSSKNIMADDGKKYTDYTLEHLKPFRVFERETKYTVYDNSKGGKFWGDQGSGILIICKTTGRILVAFRGEQVNEPHTYGIFGGKMDKGETPEESAKRELVEETGYNGKYELIPAFVYESPDKKFKYFNFIGIVEKEFEPEYDWETESSLWLSIDKLIKLEPKHFGLKKLLSKSMDIIKKFAK